MPSRSRASLSPSNSTAGSYAACPGTGDILVSPGDYIPGIPQNQFNLNLAFALSSKFTIGANVLAYSGQYAVGNENNQHQSNSGSLGSGQTDGYALLNLTASYRFAPRWEVFAKVDNLFNKKYTTGATLAENPFNSAGTFQTNSNDWASETFFAPGAPLAAWIGIRFSIDRQTR